MRYTLGALAVLLVACSSGTRGNQEQGLPGTAGSVSSLGGGSGAGGGGTGMTSNCSTGAAEPLLGARIRKLTRLEIENTLADLLGEKTRSLAAEIEADTYAIGYSTGDERGVSANYVDALARVAEQGTMQLSDAPEYAALDAACRVSLAGAEACAGTFIQHFGARALRRPLSDAEAAGLRTVYQAGVATVAPGDVGAALEAGLGNAVRALLQSSSFIFRTELGPPDAQGQTLALTPYETAAALSYALTASPPDAELTQKAAAGELATAEQVSAQGRRLLQSRPERFARQAERFVREWLGIDLSSPVWKKDGKLYPEASPAYTTALDQETALVLRDWAGNPLLTELLTRPKGFVSKTNAVAYGMQSASVDFVPTSLDASQRAGVLTLPSYLGSLAHSDSSSPVLRGVAVMKKLLCREPPPIPAMVPPLPPADQSGAKTTRERFAMHTSIAFCSACHQSFDPMGNAFEHYDAIGRYRSQENGVAVDSSGALVGSTSSDKSVADAVELSSLLASTPDVHACFVRQTYRFTLGRKEAEADNCSLAGLTQLFADQHFDLRELMLALVSSRAALERAAMTPDP